jgi:Protein of unknown function (DUF3592)
MREAISTTDVVGTTLIILGAIIALIGIFSLFYKSMPFLYDYHLTERGIELRCCRKLTLFTIKWSQIRRCEEDRRRFAMITPNLFKICLSNRWKRPVEVKTRWLTYQLTPRDTPQFVKDVNTAISEWNSDYGNPHEIPDHWHRRGRMPKTPYITFLLIWLGMVIVIGIGIGSLNWRFYRRMTTDGVAGQANVIELLPMDHKTVRYRYHVAGREFHGQRQSWPPNPPLEELAIGQMVVVYYDPEHPEQSVLGDPRPMLENETIAVTIAATGIPTMLVILWAWRHRAEMKKAQKA